MLCLGLSYFKVVCDKCDSDVSSEYKYMHFNPAFIKHKIAIIFTFVHVGLLSSQISLNGLFFSFADVSLFHLVSLSRWTCVFMSFFLSFYHFFLPSSLVEGKPCFSRPLIVRWHVWRFCVLSALLCSCEARQRPPQKVDLWKTKWGYFLYCYTFTCGWQTFVEMLKSIKKDVFFTPLLLHNITLDVFVYHLNITLCMSLTCSEFWLTCLLHYWAV